MVAARAGDEGAERELLVRICPVVLEVVRARLPAYSPDQTRVALDALVSTLKALPTFRGQEPIALAVAEIAQESLRRAGHALTPAELRASSTAARARARRGARAGDGNRVTELVKAALADDAAVLVSHIVARRPSRRSYWPYIIASLVAVALAGGFGYWLVR